MTQERRTLMLCAREFWCGDPYISGKDALEDARQVAAMLKEKTLLTMRWSKRLSALPAAC